MDQKEIELVELAKELMKRGVSISGCGLNHWGMVFCIDGFAKARYGRLFIVDSKIKLRTRYDQVDAINSLEDIVKVAYDWDHTYCREDDEYRSYIIPKPWVALYMEFGMDLRGLVGDGLHHSDGNEEQKTSGIGCTECIGK